LCIAFKNNTNSCSVNFRIFGFFEFRTPIYMVRDPELLKQIAIKDFDHFSDHRMVFDEKVDPMFGNSLGAMSGSKWKDMRASISPVFTGSKMRQMFDCVSECGANMAKTLVKNGKQAHEMKDLFTRFTNDVIASSAFGIEVNSFNERANEFYTLGLKITNFRSFATSVKFIGYLMVPWLMSLFKVHLLDNEATQYFKKIILDNFRTRDTKNIVRNDLIQLLMQIKKGKSLNTTDETKQPAPSDGFATVEESDIGKKQIVRNWTEDELLAQCFVFFLAGFDTASTLLHFITYELTLNTDVQQKLFEEIQATNNELNGKNLTYDALQSMKYLDMVISEGLRKWPPAPVTDRVCTKEYDMQLEGTNFTIEKGRVMWIPIYAFHHDHKYFPNPEKFDPERFNDENKRNINNNVYLPFGLGPRNCIGSRFALMESKAVLYYLLLNFTFEANSKTQIPLKIAKGLVGFSSEKGVHLDLVPRFVPRRM
jgi:cytochrome P450 family 9